MTTAALSHSCRPVDAASNVKGEPDAQHGKRILELDGLRGFAILIVTLYRFGRDFPADSWSSSLAGYLLHAGSSGVELFFVLSGFLITGILLDSRSSEHYFSNFMVRRALRIFPLYFVSLFLFVVVFPHLSFTSAAFSEVAGQQFYLWTYLTNVKMSLANSWCFGPLDHFWSLAVEEHFYLIWPILVLLLPASGGWGRIAIAALVIALARTAYCMSSTNELAPEVLSIFRCDSLLMGAAVAVRMRSPEGLTLLRRGSFFAFPPLLLSCIALGIDGRRWLTIGNTLWPMLWTACLIVLLTSPKHSLLARAMRVRPLLKLGQLSYAMYIFQSPLIAVMAPVLTAGVLSGAMGNAPLGHSLYIAIMFSLTVGLAWLSWHLLEKRCLAWKRYFEPHSAKSAAPAIAAATR